MTTRTNPESVPVSEVRPPPFLAAEGIGMAFGGVPVLRDVSLAAAPGEILGLVGENGAGKSTLMKIIAGLLRPAAGRLLVEGRPARFGSPLDARRAGICLIPQEFTLAAGLNVHENIFLGREPTGRAGLLDRPAMRARAARLLATLGARFAPDANVAELSAADKQLVEIAKALSQDARLLLWDEPTSVLSGPEVRALLGLMRGLRERGVAQIYISHKLPEVKEICDRVAVLRDGAPAGEAPAAEWPIADMAVRMVGGAMAAAFPPKAPAAGAPLLAVENLSVPGLLHDISFAVRRGEIFGLAGLAGSGRTELAEALMGLRRHGGRVTLDGRAARWRNPRGALAAGLSYLSEDRQGSGIVTGFPVPHNVTLSSLARYGFPFLSRARERAAAAGYVERFRIKTPSLDTPLASLSGGNQQKVSLAKSVDTAPKLLIADEPTRGVDIGARRELYRHLRALADGGMGIMLISSELEEITGLCRRAGVMRAGRLAAILENEDVNETEIMLRATGAK